MKKNKLIKAQLILPEESYKVFGNNIEYFKEEMESSWAHEYDIYIYI